MSVEKISDQLELTPQQAKNLNDIQNAILDILLEFDRICKKYDCHYSLSGGTLLGAIRHKDFIPWDDDIDIDLKRDDFFKMIKVLPEELDDRFEFVNYNEFGEYFCDFIPRIYYRNCTVSNSFSLDGGKTNFANDARINRIFIELYCLHDTKTGAFLKRQQFKTKMIYGLAMGHRLVQKPKDSYSALEKLESSVLTAVGKKMPLEKIYAMYEKNAALVPTGEGDAYFKPSVPLPVLERNTFDKHYFDGYTEVEMRGKTVMAPKNYVEILELLYGNWQDLPPEKDRHPSHYYLDSIVFTDR